jgi:hypothetical protein
MGAGIEKFVETPTRIRNRARIGNANAIEAERAGLVHQLCL